MIDISEFKKSLGVLVEELSEEDILKLREQQDQMAEYIFNSWLEGINEKSDKINS